jgi:hypothetical protein
MSHNLKAGDTLSKNCQFKTWHEDWVAFIDNQVLNSEGYDKSSQII